MSNQTETGWNPINQSYKVDNEGIKLITDYVGSYIKEELIMPKRVFIEAYNKYIKEVEMRKYQKIQEIMNADLEHIHPLDRDKYIVASIKEVIDNVD